MRLNRVVCRRTAIGAAILATSALIVPAFASGSSGAVGIPSSSQSPTGLKLAEQRLQALYNGSTFGKPPATAPRGQRGKRVWIIDAGLAAPGDAIWAAAAKQAGTSLGWTMTVYDGQFTPSRYLAGIRLAIAAKANGIILVLIDCSSAEAALQEAHRAGIEISVIESTDCGDQKPGAPDLFDANVIYRVGGKPARFLQMMQELGASQADIVAVHTKGKGKIIVLKNTDTFVNVVLYNGFVAELKKVCPSCQIAQTVDFVQADTTGTAMSQKIQQAILQNPAADALVAPYDDILTNGGSAAIVASGRSSQLFVVAGIGEPAANDLIRENKGLNASYGLALGWEAYASVDSLNRLFNGQKPLPSGLGLAMVDKTHNLAPHGQSYQPPVNYKADYVKAWNGGH